MKVVVNPPAGIGVNPSQNQVVRLGVGGTAINAVAINSSVNAAANTVAVYANGILVLANADLNFNNTATVNVFATANGIGQVNISFTANVSLNGGATIIATDAIIANSISVGNVIISNNVSLSVADFTSISGTTTANQIPVQIDSFSSSVYTCVDYIIQLTTINALHCSKILAMQDGISTYGTEYATLFSNGSLGIFSVGFSGSSVDLFYIPINPLNQIIYFKIIRQTITN